MHLHDCQLAALLVEEAVERDHAWFVGLDELDLLGDVLASLLGLPGLDRHREDVDNWPCHDGLLRVSMLPRTGAPSRLLDDILTCAANVLLTAGCGRRRGVPHPGVDGGPGRSSARRAAIGEGPLASSTLDAPCGGAGFFRSAHR